MIYSYRGDFYNSIFYLKRAIEIEPNLSKAYNDLGTVYAQMGEADLAIENMEKSIEINPYQIDYYIYNFLYVNFEQQAYYYLDHILIKLLYLIL